MMHFDKETLKKLWSGPLAFLLANLILSPLTGWAGALAVGTAFWMALWWIFRPVHIAVTSMLPIAVNGVCSLIPNSHVISQYFTDIVVLLLGADLICMAWSTTGLDRRISLRAICFIGTSMRQQIFVWLAASVLMSAFLPNTVVAAILCPIAAGMLKVTGQKDISTSAAAVPILLAIGWGSGIGGFGTPIGSPANLVAISYIEDLTGHEFMYIEWMRWFVPILLAVSICLPLTVSVCQTLGLPPVPYVIGTIAASSCAYILPVTTRAVPVGYGLDAKVQMHQGLRLSILTMLVNNCVCWAAMTFLAG